MSNRPIKTAVIGFGLSGRVFHCPFIHCHPGFELTKVVERHKEDSKLLYPEVSICKSSQDVLEDPEIEMVVVCTPNTLHFETTRAALEAGKHVVLEKPMTSTSEEAMELINIAKTQNKSLLVYHNRRWDGDFLFIEELLNKKTLGTINYYEAHFDRFVPIVSSKKTWKNTSLPASGVLFDLGSHLIHQAISLFGLPTAVEATIETKRADSQVTDSFELIMDYPGLTAVIKSDMLVEDHALRFLIRGDNTELRQYGMDPQEASLDQGLMPKDKDWCPSNPSHFATLAHKTDSMQTFNTAPGDYMAFYENVYAVIRENVPMIIEPIEGAQVIKICELAIKSHQTKRKIKL